MTTERDDLTEALRKHRGLFLLTVRGLSDDQARLSPTTSTLTLGGLVKHVSLVEERWARFIVQGADEAENAIDWASIDWSDPPAHVRGFMEAFTMLDHETLDGLLAGYDDVARRTDALIADVDLDARRPLPVAPWFEAGASWSARRVLVHVLAETAQHAGHADLLRESIDGQKSMA